MGDYEFQDYQVNLNYRRRAYELNYRPDTEFEFYDKVMEIYDFQGGRGNVSLRFVDSRNTTEVRNITIIADSLDSYADFQERIDYITSGRMFNETEGSDFWVNNEAKHFYLDRESFEIDKTEFEGFGTNKKIFRERELNKMKGYGHNGKKCGIRVVDTIQTLGGERYEEKDWEYWSQYANMLKYAKRNGISILRNAIIPDRNGTLYKPRGRKDWKYIDGHKLMRIHTDSWEPEYYYKGTNTEFHIIYDEVSKHFSLMVGDIGLDPDLRMDFSNKFYRRKKGKYEVVYTPTDNYKRQSKKNHIKQQYCIYDIETIVDRLALNSMEPYSVSYLIVNDNELKELDELDKQGKSLEAFEDKAKVKVGFNCIEDMLWDIMDLLHNTNTIFMSFNGANFDNFILVDKILTANPKLKEAYELTNLQYNGSQLLNFRLNKSHSAFDLAKHIAGFKLKDLCDNFGLQNGAKGDLNHNSIQQLYDKYGRERFIEKLEEIYGDKLRKYNKYDCISTGIIYWKYREQLLKIPCVVKYAEKLYETITIGSLSYKIFQDNQAKLGVKFPLLEKEHYYDMLEYKIAGRVEMFNGRQKINERMASLDVCSLYPFILAIKKDVWFPHGDIVEWDYTGKDFNKEDERIGWFYCDIDQSTLIAENKPQYYATKTKEGNDWNDPKQNNIFINTIAIKKLEELGCLTGVRKGFYFTDKIRGYDLFGFLVEFMKIKMEQDKLKAEGNPKYNNALRETIKLLSNSISGKIIEGLHEQTTELLTTKSYTKLMDKGIEVNVSQVIGDRAFVSYEKTFEELRKKQRPIFLGCICYEEARKYMYENIYVPTGLDKLVYTDTDASKCRYKDIPMKFLKTTKMKDLVWDEILDIEPNYKTFSLYDKKGKVYGSFEEELKPDNKIFHCVQKKMYYSSSGPNSKNKPKISMKGLSPCSVIITKDMKLYDKDNKLDNYKCSQVYRNPKNRIYDKENGVDNLEEMFDTFERNHILDKKKGDKEQKGTGILCRSFAKCVKTNYKKTSLTDIKRHSKVINKVRLQYSVKYIQLKDMPEII